MAHFGATDWPCSADAKKHCAAAQGEQPILACLKKSRLRLSDACKQELDSLDKAAQKPAEPDCEKDAQKKKPTQNRHHPTQ